MDPITRTHIANLKRSYAMSQSLPAGEIERLLDETDRLLLQHEQMVAALADLRIPWATLKEQLAALDQTLARPGDDP